MMAYVVVLQKESAARMGVPATVEFAFRLDPPSRIYLRLAGDGAGLQKSTNEKKLDWGGCLRP
jgi:hypothetical protein